MVIDNNGPIACCPTAKSKVHVRITTWGFEGQCNVNHNVFIAGFCPWWDHRNVSKLGEIIVSNVEDHSLAIIALDMREEVAVIAQPAGSDQLVVDDWARARWWVLREVSIGLQLQEEVVQETEEVQGVLRVVSAYEGGYVNNGVSH